MSEIIIFILGTVFGIIVTAAAFGFALDVMSSKHERERENRRVVNYD